jgi:hypothetical protein
MAGCGSGGSGASTSVNGVTACLENAGFGVTIVPSSEVTGDGSESRGPGQTGELLIARAGVTPAVGSDNADAVVAFWKSASLAKSSPNAKDSVLGRHADALGSITVQPTTHLVEFALAAAKTPNGRKAALQAEVKKIEDCVG